MGAAATHRTGPSVRIAQDEGRCRRQYSPPWPRCRRAVIACSGTPPVVAVIRRMPSHAGALPALVATGSAAAPRDYGPYSPAIRLLSGHKPVEGRTVRRLPWRTKLHCLLRRSGPICRRDGTAYGWLPIALTIMTSNPRVTHRVSRRQFCSAMALTAAGVAVAACRTGARSTPSPSATGAFRDATLVFPKCSFIDHTPVALKSSRV